MNNKINEVYLSIKESLKLGQSSVDSLILELAKQKVDLMAFSQKLKILEANQKIRDVLLPNLSSLYSGRRKLNISCDSTLAAEQGFYPIEYNKVGKTYRWTGPSPTFFFDAHLDRTVPIEFVMHLQKRNVNKADQLRCFVDSVEVPMIFKSTNSSQFIEYSAVLMPRSFLGLTRVEFRVGSMFCPEGTEDARVLGVVFLGLDFNEASEDVVTNYLNEFKFQSE